MTVKGTTAAVVGAVMMAAAFPAGAQELTLAEAERLALRDDPVMAGLEARALALDEQSVADGQLPDPMLKLGVMNLPVDGFDFTQEAMTQAQIGLRQTFPRGDTLALRTERGGALAGAERARQRDEARKIVRATRLRWLDAFYWTRAADILGESRMAVENLIQVSQFLYSTGRQNQQDVFRAELEYSLLEDRLVGIAAKQDVARAEMAKWIGADGVRPLPVTLPELAEPRPPGDVLAALAGHPSVAAEDRLIQARQSDIDLARQVYQPEWNVDLTYGFRGGEDFGRGDRADFLSLMVTMDLPFFTERRQDRRLSASKHRAAAALNRRDDRLRELRRVLQSEHATWARLGERERLYARTVVQRAADNYDASLRAYRNDVTEFTTVMRAQITEIDTRLQWLRVRVDRAMTAMSLSLLKFVWQASLVDEAMLPS
jgi:outer membrane protein TolC